MLKMRLVLFLLLQMCGAGAQPHPPGTILRFGSHFSMFPDSLRNATPREYEGKSYAAREHYSDSSVLVFVPDYFKKDQPVNIICWFYGWSNNIDSALAQFHLLDQFYTAGRNAVFVFPEGPKNSPDSYAGKFQQPGTFDSLMAEIRTRLSAAGVFNTPKLSSKIKNKFTYTLAGHSGAYKAIAYCDSLSPLVSENLLFDALYGEFTKFSTWLSSGQGKRLVNIYTDNGGTMQNSLNFLTTLDSLHIAYLHKEEKDLTPVDLRDYPCIFLHTRQTHNEVIATNRNLQRFLQKN